jgi:hypothetical protein
MHQSGPVRADFRPLSPPSSRFSGAFFGCVELPRIGPLRIQLSDIFCSAQGADSLPSAQFCGARVDPTHDTGPECCWSIFCTEKGAIRLQHAAIADIHETGRQSGQHETERIH